MLTIRLHRVCTNDSGTFGVLLDEEGIPICVTLENSWRNNTPFTSCIPFGLYKCARYLSGKFGETFQVLKVMGRTSIIFHTGNTHLDTEGCILLGTSFGFLSVPPAGMLPSVCESKIAFDKFTQKLEGINTFLLEIRE